MHSSFVERIVETSDDIKFTIMDLFIHGRQERLTGFDRKMRDWKFWEIFGATVISRTFLGILGITSSSFNTFSVIPENSRELTEVCEHQINQLVQKKWFSRFSGKSQE